MERFTLTYPAKQPFAKKALAGVVGSGDLQALYEPQQTQHLVITVTTSVNGSQKLWAHLFEHIFTNRLIPAGQLYLNDFGATPGVASLRIEQAFEEASHVNQA